MLPLHLQSGAAALFVNEAHDARQRLNMVVAKNSKILRTNMSFRQNRRRFQEDQPGPDHGTAPEMHDMPIGGETMLA